MNHSANPHDKPAIDWPAIELDYRAGIKSLRALGAERGISAGRIAQVAKAKGWTRDLNARIHAEAAARLAREGLNTALNSESAAMERNCVEAHVESIVTVVRGHRRKIEQTLSLASMLLAELENMTENPGNLQRLAALVNCDGGGELDRLLPELLRAISLSNRCSILKALAEILKTLIKLDRQAFGIKDEAPTTNISAVLTTGPAVATNLDQLRLRVAGWLPP